MSSGCGPARLALGDGHMNDGPGPSWLLWHCDDEARRGTGRAQALRFHQLSQRAASLGIRRLRHTSPSEPIAGRGPSTAAPRLRQLC